MVGKCSTARCYPLRSYVAPYCYSFCSLHRRPRAVAVRCVGATASRRKPDQGRDARGGSAMRHGRLPATKRDRRGGGGAATCRGKGNRHARHPRLTSPAGAPGGLHARIPAPPAPWPKAGGEGRLCRASLQHAVGAPCLLSAPRRWRRGRRGEERRCRAPLPRTARREGRWWRAAAVHCCHAPWEAYAPYPSRLPNYLVV
jgi:hypothetical protein